MAKLSDLLGYGRDFAQGASNAAASNVSAPVDGLAWLLRKAGMNIQNPVGGSDWMRAKGLTAEPQNRLAGLLGESVGGVAPMLAAAKAPQIAGGLLQAGENLAAPRTMNPQTGAVVWHGSPHQFDKFDSGKIGTGEGAQAYGHGLYLADSPDVAKQYAGMNPASSVRVLPNGNQFDVVATHDSGPLRELGTFGSKAEAQKIASEYTGANHYKVDLPDEHIAKMLDWDKPLSAQHPDVQAALEAYAPNLPAKLQDQTLRSIRGQLTDYERDWAPVTGASFYRQLGSAKSAGQKVTANGVQDMNPAAADLLRQAGIPGIRYLDGGSRGAGTGSSNYVVFPGNENLLSILQRNGQAVK